MKYFAIVVSVFVPCVAGADLTLTGFSYDPTTHSYSVGVCSNGIGSAQVGFYYDPKAPPSLATPEDLIQSNMAGPLCPVLTIARKNSPVGLYQDYAMVDPKNVHMESNEGNNVIGPLEVCVGPDVYLKTWDIKISGASVTYEAQVCNKGSQDANKFRVGFWHNRSATPGATEMGNIFDPITVLAPGKCEDIKVSGGLRPNGTFYAYARADSGNFVVECRETNNPKGPRKYSLSNPDLDVVSFSASVNGSTVTYSARVCNKGTAAVTKFYTDIYYNRTTKAPNIGDPGDEAKATASLKPGACTDLTYTRSNAPKGTYNSYVFADPDDFISEPKESNNLSSPLSVVVGSGSGTTGSCTDSDKDGAGIGVGCKGVPDCNDNDDKINPKATEICGDKIDQDCDLTPDDGCAGVKCTDSDGDSFGVGPDCVLADCDDTNKDIYPWAPEKCGDNKDDNCNKIADDGCKNRKCVDQDMDGYGVGVGCPGPQDCDDADRSVNPGMKDICGNGVDDDCDTVPDDDVVAGDPKCKSATDGDGDGSSVGAGATGQPDCDDQNAKIGPGQKEVCGDKIDNDCDGTVDDGCPGVACTDADKDGWGVGKDCKIPDCNDKDAAIHPWATETCKDSKDNDCDGTIDDGCPGVDCTDEDHDSWGIGKDCCNDKTNNVVCRKDCDDKSGGLSPWVEEICADDKDNNCDGTIDESCPVCTDADKDDAGIGPKCSTWDCDDTDPDSYPGAEEKCNNKDNDCNGTDDNDCTADDVGCSCRAAAATTAWPSGRAPLLPLGGLALMLTLLLVARRRRGD